MKWKRRKWRRTRKEQLRCVFINKLMFSKKFSSIFFHLFLFWWLLFSFHLLSFSSSWKLSENLKQNQFFKERIVVFSLIFDTAFFFSCLLGNLAELFFCFKNSFFSFFFFNFWKIIVGVLETLNYWWHKIFDNVVTTKIVE